MEVVSGDNWSYNAYKASVKSSPPTYQHPAFYRPDALPVAQPTVSEYCHKNECLQEDGSRQTVQRSKGVLHTSEL